MAVLWIILKIIGILLLCLLVFVCLMLFAPVGYVCRGVWNDREKWAGGRISWLFFFLRMKVVWREGEEPGISLRVLGFPVYHSDEERWSLLNRKTDEDVLEIRDSGKDIKEQDRAPQMIQPSDTEVSPEEHKILPDDILDYTGDGEELKDIEEEKYEKPPLRKRVKSFLKRCYNTGKRLYKRLKYILDKTSSFKELLEDEELISAVKRVLGYSKKGIRHFIPKKLSGEIAFGFEDPAQTGQTLAAVSVLMPLFGGSLSVEPDFKRARFEADLTVSGRIYAFHFLKLAWDMFRDKELWRQKERILRTIGG